MEMFEAVKVLSSIKEHFCWVDIDKELVSLDGFFTITQLEAIITIYKHRDEIKLLEE